MRKKLMLLLAAISVLSFAEGLEIKASLDLYQNLDIEDNNGDVIDTEGKLGPGFGLGLEYLYRPQGRKFDFGIGAEYKFPSDEKFDGEKDDDHVDSVEISSIPLYLVGKYNFNEKFYGIARGGYSFVDMEVDVNGKKTDADIDGGLYLAGGVGMNIKERFNLELLYEYTDLDGELEDINPDLDGFYDDISLKFGFKLNPKTEEVPVVKPEPPKPEPPVEKPIVKPEPPKPEPPVEKPLELSLRKSFETNSHNLTPAAKDEIKRTAKAVNEYSKGGKLLIYGHTDSVGKASYNQSLSEKRAISVANEYGKYISNSKVEFDVRGYGESQPVASNDTEAGREQNRRVDVKFVPNK